MGIMLINLNGKEHVAKDNITLEDFLLTQNLPKFFVVEKNGIVIYKEKYSTEKINEGDTLEIASFCGGG